ncbi:hypothetical protein C8F01DRAFT_1119707 [Mycena amicta]|nr:hypothetical protein C8F01DRAFT_1119707 [Mycena amicta]
MPSHYKRIVLASRPDVLVQVTWLSLDPAMRGYIRDVRSYLPPVQIGETMRAQGLGVVIKTGKGQRLDCRPARHWPIRVPKGVQAIDFLNTLGLSGLTAYFGVKDICDVKPGVTMVVSGAAGSVGSVACQLGKRAGAKVYAIAGSQDKCEWLEKELGVDRAFNYKSKTFRQDFKEIGYIDVYFDNVGGEILDLVLSRLNKGATVALCGAISQYNATKPTGLKNYLTLISQRAKIQGFIIMDYTPRFPAAIQDLAGALADGSIKRKFHVVEGIEQAPIALPWLFSGKNDGKLVVKVAEEPKAKL